MAKKEARGSLLALTLALSFLQPGEALASSPQSSVQPDSSKSASGESVIEINDWRSPLKTFRGLK
jgi:hypothetical protein